MYAVKVEGGAGQNLNSAIDQILEGALDDLAAVDEVKSDTTGGGLFAADPECSYTFVVHFKVPPPPEIRAMIVAAIRMLVGNTAHIEEIEK